MSFISPIATDANGQPKATGSMQKLGRDDFLQLLVTKLQYQDPLKPMEDEAFIAQLAQFSTLEQMNNISDGISTSNRWNYLQMQSVNNMMAAGLVGKEVTASYKSVYWDGENKPTASFELPAFASKVQMIITDSQGNVVNTITRENVEAGVSSIKWDGTDKMGNTVDKGDYSIEVTATDANGAAMDPNMSIVGTVSEIRYRDGSAYLVVNGTEIPLSDISAVGEVDG